MHYGWSRALGAAGLSLAIATLSAVSAQTASASQASASGISASFTSGGVRTIITPVAPVMGGTVSAKYKRSADSGVYQKTLLLAAGSTPVPALTVTAKNFHSHVEGIFGVDTLSSEGDGTALGLDLSLQLYPPVPGPVPQPFLHITATKLKETGSFNEIAPGFATVAAGAEVTGLSISGSLLHGETLQYSGSPRENKVLFKSPTMTITLNHEITSELISCRPKCVVTPVAISASGIEITLTNADVNGRKVSGQIDIATGAAGSEL